MAVDVGNVCFLAFFLVLVILYGLFTEYATPAEVSRYAFFQDVHVMIFIGFGFLMTFLHKSGFTAVSHSYFVAVLTVLWATYWFDASSRSPSRSTPSGRR